MPGRTLRAQGTEFLVKALLEMMNVPTAHIGGTHSGYDLVATNPDEKRSCTIQVKGRAGTNYGFWLKDPRAADFVVFVPATYPPTKTPKFECYVLPRAVCARYHRPVEKKLILADIRKPERYLSNWEPVFMHLGMA